MIQIIVFFYDNTLLLLISALLRKDTKGEIRQSNSKKHRKHNGQNEKDKMSNIDLHRRHAKIWPLSYQIL